MKVEQAKKLTRKAAELAARRANKAAKAEADRIRKANRDYMKNEYPGFQAGVYADIKAATASQAHSITIEPPNSAAWEKLEKKLLKDGFQVQSYFVQGEYENMGDFNAPCNVWRDSYWYYKVSW